MGLEASKKKEHEPIVIEFGDYENIEALLSKVIVPFSEVLRTSNFPDLYLGYEEIPFQKRDPHYQAIMRQEFADAL
jgi:hypothetical protein